MSIFNKVLKTGFSITFLLAGLTVNAWGLGVGGGGAGIAAGGGELRGPNIIAGRVICAQCDIDEVQAAQPDLTSLYELRHADGQVVMQIDPREDTLTDDVWWLSDGAVRWQRLDRASVRAGWPGLGCEHPDAD